MVHPSDHAATIPQEEALRFQLALIGGQRDGYIEGRVEICGTYTGYYCQSKRTDQGARELWDGLRGCMSNVYVGCAPRFQHGRGANSCGTNEDVARSWCLWADCDTPESQRNLDHFDRLPSLVVSSGRGLHVWWALSEPVPADRIKQANRRIAYRLGADPLATNPSRILRMVGSWNRKHDKPVICTSLEPTETYRPGELVNDLPNHPADQRDDREYDARDLPRVATEKCLAGPLRKLRSAIRGERNAMLYWAAKVAYREADNLELARELLTDAGLAVGLDEREIAGTIASAWRAR